MEQEVNMKMVCIVMQSSEKASQVFYNALQKFIAKQSNNYTKSKDSAVNKAEPKGKIVKVKDLRKDGDQVEFEKMGNDNMKDFRKYARKYGVSYSMEKDKSSTPPTYMIFFKAKDGNLIRKAMNSFVAEKMKDDKEKPEKGISNALIDAKDKVSKQPSKVKKKEKIR